MEKQKGQTQRGASVTSVPAQLVERELVRAIALGNVSKIRPVSIRVGPSETVYVLGEDGTMQLLKDLCRVRMPGLSSTEAKVQK
jgi:hypothetical protein